MEPPNSRRSEIYRFLFFAAAVVVVLCLSYAFYGWQCYVLGMAAPAEANQLYLAIHLDTTSLADVDKLAAQGETLEEEEFATRMPRAYAEKGRGDEERGVLKRFYVFKSFSLEVHFDSADRVVYKCLRWVD